MWEETDVATFPRAKGNIDTMYVLMEREGPASTPNNERVGVITHTTAMRCAIDTVCG